MKKMFFLAATAALALSSCSSDELVQAEQPVVEDGAVVFSAQTLRNTRAGYANEGDPIHDLADLTNAKGFGVFGYDQNAVVWKTFSAGNTYPNFFYNQQVTGKAGSGTPATYTWSYDPVKYYNNNAGALHSFFAYAPYQADVKAVFNYDGPAIRYTANDNYDLLYAPATINLEKPGVNQKIQFDFQHALSQVNFQVSTFVDDVHGAAHNSSNVADKTTVTLRSVKFVGNLPSQALLSLTDGSWKVEKMEEGVYEFCVNPVVMDKTTAWTVPEGDGAKALRVTEKPQMIIPTVNGGKVNIQVIYDVETIDEKNPQNSSLITNTITSTEEFDLAKGKAYQFCLDLGLTSVKFDASVKDWDPSTLADTEVDLPNNTYAEPVDAHSAANVKVKNDTSEPSASDVTAVGDVVISSDKKKVWVCKTYTAEGTPTATFEEVNPAYPYIYDSTGKKVYVWNSTVYAEPANVVEVSSVIPDKDGKLWNGTSEVTTSVSDGTYLICNGKLYIWNKPGTSSNRR